MKTNEAVDTLAAWQQALAATESTVRRLGDAGVDNVYLSHRHDGTVTVRSYAVNADEFAAWAKAASRVFGRVDKAGDDHGVYLTAAITDTAVFELHPINGVCERVQVGTEVRTVTRIVTPAVEEEVEEEVPVYETRCPDSVLALGKIEVSA